ncbi:conserved hypothetical protein [Chloroherpeton thalassium ATCC 35110]|uniref:DUF721 domain-containing protein n=1 Tax=Chloroherpeton thalassium (strain ATCC 35110 / GB-78) TaxID=517418 RepID=B3QWU8_CHLT3|nr:DUF721 domain-containing protein [Chloroherpeton thalassium]ACF13312.1 conserved hypothetical protein [Chloroherpeton thalassium ATCC 35110]
MPYTDEPRSFGSVLEVLYKKLGLEGYAKEFKAVSVWGTVVGPHIARVSEVEKIVNGVLYVKVKNSAWRNELNFKKVTIIHQLNKHIGQELVIDIVFR